MEEQRAYFLNTANVNTISFAIKHPHIFLKFTALILSMASTKKHKPTNQPVRQINEHESHLARTKAWLESWVQSVRLECRKVK